MRRFVIGAGVACSMAAGLPAAAGHAQNAGPPAAQPLEHQELFPGLNQFVAAEVDERRVQVADAASHAALARATGRPDLVARLDFLEERVFYFAGPQHLDLRAIERYRDVLAAAPWTCLIRVNEPEHTVDVCERAGLPEGVEEYAQIVIGRQQVLFLNARGRLSLAQMDELSKLAGAPDERKNR